MDKQSLLNILLWLPLLGAFMVWLIPNFGGCPAHEENCPTKSPLHITLAILLFQFAVAICFWQTFDNSDATLQHATNLSWIKPWGVSYHIGIEGINLLLILLSALIFPLVAFVAYYQISKNLRLFCAMLLFMQFAVFGALLAQDLFLFYIFWESMLIPAFVFIVVWGGKKRITAVYRFFLYTALGSILMLGAIIYLAWQVSVSTGSISFAYSEIFKLNLSNSAQLWLFCAFALAFAIKLPLFPVHSWQAITYKHSPILATVIFAAVLSKVGAYGLIKLAYPLFPQAVNILSPLLIFLAVSGIVYGALIAFVQTNIKTLLAYSSLSHLSFVLLALTSVNSIATQGALIHLFSHGLVVAGLFLMVAMLSQKFSANEFNDGKISGFSGLTKIMPTFATFFIIFTLASIGLPTTSGFVGEFFILLGAFTNAWALLEDFPMLLVMVAIATGGVIFGAVYMLRLCQNILFGELKVGKLTPKELTDNKIFDLRLGEKVVLTILVLAIFVIGLYPQVILNKTTNAVENYQQKVNILTQRTN